MPPLPRPHPAAGQASLDYVGLRALVAGAVAVSDERRGGGGAVTILSVRLGGGHQWLVARRSDGSVAVTKVARDELGASGGLGYELGPLKAGVEGEAGLRVASGVGWEFPDAASAARFLEAARYGLSGAIARWPAAWRSGEGGLATKGWAGLGVVLTGEDGKAVGGPAAGIEVAADSALGARIARGSTTLYLRAETDGLHTTGALGDLLDAGPRGPVVAEYTRDRSGPRELAFRVSARGARANEVVETVARLDLRVHSNRAVAARLLRHRAPWPPSVAADLRAAVAQAVRSGTVERSVFAVEDGSRSLELAGRLGAEVGIEAGYTKVDRRLLEASARTAGSQPRAREDCVA